VWLVVGGWWLVVGGWYPHKQLDGNSEVLSSFIIHRSFVIAGVAPINNDK
jgi:hypothetical protein